MTYAHLKLKIPPELDKRRKLTDPDREDIKRLFFIEGLAIKEIARRYEKKCSRTLIQFVIYPERLKRQRKLHKERRKDGRYYDKDKWREQMKTHRRYKQGLYLANKLKK